MTIATIAATAATALVALSALPFALPADVHVERSAVIDAAPETLYGLIASNEGYQSFNPYKSADPDLKIALHGPASGVGSGFDFDGKDGTGRQVIAAVEPNRAVHMDIDLGAMGQPTQSFLLEPVEGGTRVTWGMDMSFGKNPIGRVFGLFMDRMVGGTFDKGLENLARVTQDHA